MGIFAPGFKEVGDFFQEMWNDILADQEKWGRKKSLLFSHTVHHFSILYLFGDQKNSHLLAVIGKSTTLVSLPSTSNSGPALINLSYWKSAAHLHAYASSPTHRRGLDWWFSTAKKRYPHLGIMHETFEAPKGKYENVYDGFEPTGMGE